MNPLRGRTWRRIVHVLLGAVLLLPYLAFGWLFTAAAASGMSLAALVPLLLVAVVVGVAVAVVPGVRALEVTAARALLGVELPDPDPATERDRSARGRGAAWLLLNMVLGGLGALVVLIGLPVAVGLVIAPFSPQRGLPTGAAAWWTLPLGVLVAVVVPVLLAAAGEALARLAPRLLGPTPSERLATELAAERRRVTALAERARIARELHDSVGHALTVTTLQAGAAAQLLDTDPAFVRRALCAIEETGRRALDELDHVLGVLREEGELEPPRDLDALDSLVAGARSAGVDVELHRDGELAALPAVVSREAYRLVQEALTNALRHAGPVPVTVRLAAGDADLTITVDNPLPSGARATNGRSGRGLRGMAERASLLGGELTAGPDGGVWRLAARLPGGAR